MDTHIAYQAYQAQAANQANFESTILWILFALLVITPLLFAVIWIPIAIAKQPKCPTCGSKKVDTGIETITENNATIRRKVHICRKDKTQFY